MKNRFKFLITTFTLLLTFAFMLFAGHAARSITVNTDGSLSYTYDATYQVNATIGMEVTTTITDQAYLETLPTDQTINIVPKDLENKAETFSLANLTFPNTAYKNDTITVTFTITNNNAAETTDLILGWEALVVTPNEDDLSGVSVAGTALEATEDETITAQNNTQITIVFKLDDATKKSDLTFGLFKIKLKSDLNYTPANNLLVGSN